MISLPEKRQIENEVVFRKANEKVLEELKLLTKMAKSEGNASMAPDKDLKLHFFCECSDENCHERIVLTLGKYQDLHKDRSKFIVSPDHETAAIEKVVAKKVKYSVVDKFVTPSEKATTLNATTVDNS